MSRCRMNDYFAERETERKPKSRAEREAKKAERSAAKIQKAMANIYAYMANGTPIPQPSEEDKALYRAIGKGGAF